MACDCKQGYVLPGMNLTPCGCQRGYSGPRPYGMGRPVNQPFALGGGIGPRQSLGAITQQMAPIAPGGSFAFGFQESTLRLPWPFLDETKFASYLEDAGLSYNTTSSVLTGHLNPYVTITGNSLLYYDSATQLAYDILNVLQQNNVPVDTSVVNFQAEPYDPNATNPLPMVGLPPPTTTTPGAGAGQPPGPTKCDWSSMSIGQWIACEVGLSNPLAAAGTGALIGVAAIVGILLLAKR